MDGTLFGISALIEAYLAGACPRPAETTFPRITSSTDSAGMLAFYKAALPAVPAKSVALSFESLPMNEPMGVLAADTIKVAWLYFYFDTFSWTEAVMNLIANHK